MELKATHGLTWAVVAYVAMTSAVATAAVDQSGGADGRGVYEWAIWAGTNFGVGLALLWILIMTKTLYLGREYNRLAEDNARLVARCERLERLADSATGVTERLVRS